MFYLILPSFIEFIRELLSFTRFYWVLLGFYQNLPIFTEFYRVLPSFFGQVSRRRWIFTEFFFYCCFLPSFAKRRWKQPPPLPNKKKNLKKKISKTTKKNKRKARRPNRRTMRKSARFVTPPPDSRLNRPITVPLARHWPRRALMARPTPTFH